MKKHQFEEITMGISIIICLIAYKLEINWLYYIFFAKSIFDFIAAIKAAVTSVNKRKKQNNLATLLDERNKQLKDLIDDNSCLKNDYERLLNDYNKCKDELCNAKEEVMPQNKCIGHCTYSKAMNQVSPRLCVKCGTPEKERRVHMQTDIDFLQILTKWCTEHKVQFSGQESSVINSAAIEYAAKFKTRPWLGLATTSELIYELAARCDTGSIDKGGNYKTFES